MKNKPAHLYQPLPTDRELQKIDSNYTPPFLFHFLAHTSAKTRYPNHTLRNRCKTRQKNDIYYRWIEIA